MPWRLLAVGLMLLVAACGSSGGDPSSVPTPSPTLGPPTITIRAAGVDPQVLHTFDERETVTVVNADARAHDLRSDPHPAHTDCPAINLGPMMPGERREIAGPSLPAFTLCYYHDETDPTNNSYRGVVVTH